MWKMIGKPELALVTHELATTYMDMEPCKGDRILRTAREEKIKDAVTEGTFRTCSWATAYCIEDGKTYRVNGKHTSNVMAKMNGSLPVVWAVIERFICDTLEDVAALYATFDSRTSSRTAGDINRAYTSADFDLSLIPQDINCLCATAIDIALSKCARVCTRTAEDRAVTAVKNKDFILWFANIIGNRCKGNKHVFRGAVAAAMFQCWKLDHEAATDFWQRVVNGSDPAPDYPSRKLQSELLSTVGVDGNVERRRGYSKCIYAWNAYRRGITSLKVLKYLPDADVPDAI
jgi:hypothetical protein